MSPRLPNFADVSNTPDIRRHEVNRTSFRRAVVPGVAVVALGVGLTACGAGNESVRQRLRTLRHAQRCRLQPAQEAAQGAWRAGFQGDNPGVTVNYDPAGSGGGREQFIAGGVDFAGSDSYLGRRRGEARPTPRSAAAARTRSRSRPTSARSPLVYNLEGVDELQLSAEDRRPRSSTARSPAGTTRPSRPRTPDADAARRRGSPRCTARTTRAPPTTSPSTSARPPTGAWTARAGRRVAAQVR